MLLSAISPSLFLKLLATLIYAVLWSKSRRRTKSSSFVPKLSERGKWLWQDSNEWSPVFSLNKMLLLWLFLWMRLQDVKILSEIMFCFRMIRKICVQWTLKQMSRKWRGGKELKQSWTAKYEKFSDILDFKGSYRGEELCLQFNYF